VMKVVLATGNQAKLIEFISLMGDGIEVLSLKDFSNLSDIIEDGDSFKENALIKARETVKYTGMVAVADDSGLEVDFLAGAPGIYSARFAGEPSDDKRNNDKLLSLLHGVPWEKRTARFTCALAVVTPEGEEYLTEGTCEGYILGEPQGSEGFGYDPLFYYPALDKSFAELGVEIKNSISHRARAFLAGRDVIKAVLEKRKC